MLADEVVKEEKVEKEKPSYIHSYLCAEIIEQLLQNKNVRPFPELTLAIESGLTPDISVYPRSEIKPDFWKDVIKFPEMPILPIEITSSSQNIQDLIDNGVKAVWTIEPFSSTVFVTAKEGKKRFHNQEVESENIKVDFNQIFPTFFPLDLGKNKSEVLILDEILFNQFLKDLS